MIVEVTEEFPVHDHFIWLTLRDIRQLLQIPNLVNMDARSVLACISLADQEALNEAGPERHLLFKSLLDRDWDELDQALSWFTVGLGTRWWRRAPPPFGGTLSMARCTAACRPAQRSLLHQNTGPAVRAATPT